VGVLASRATLRRNQALAVGRVKAQFADFLLDKFPFRVEVIQTDIQAV
jgi:hypothetical protein